jgi:nucleotide-binding universal stress UspA family protein
MRILIGTDGSDHAVDAARQALGVLAAPDVVSVVCVMEVPAEATAGMESGFVGGMAEPADVDAAWASSNSEADAALDRTAAVLPAGTTVERVIEHGEAGSVICRLAGEQGADAVVVGSRGRGALKRALLGSVSTFVANNAPCPVVIVGAGSD